MINSEIIEQNFTSVDIGEDIHIKTPFQEDRDVKYTIVVQPRMAFGTGHHPTTQLSALSLLDTNCLNKVVLDMGCGTGILAILASKLGAKKVIGIDYDLNSVENARENVQLNNSKNVEILHADNTTMLTDKIDIVISNIVKNINLRLLYDFVRILNDNGLLILSGFLKSDLNELKSIGKAHKLELLEQRTDDQWLQVKFIKR